MQKLTSLRVVLSHMVVKPPYVVCPSYIRLRVVLSHMVVKRRSKPETNNYEFESSVISYGSQTLNPCDLAAVLFESSVISYGSQTEYTDDQELALFESSVISYGSQTAK